MRRNVLFAAAAMLTVLGHGFMTSGRYSLQRVGDEMSFRLDRWTGEVTICAYWSNGTFSCSQEWTSAASQPGPASNGS